MPFGQPGIMNRQNMGMKLGAGGPRARPMSPTVPAQGRLIQSASPEATNGGYGRAAVAPPIGQTKTEPTGGAQVGPRTQFQAPRMGVDQPSNFSEIPRGGPMTGVGPSPNASMWGNMARNVGNAFNRINRPIDVAQQMQPFQRPAVMPRTPAPEEMSPSPLEQQIMASKPEAMANMARNVGNAFNMANMDAVGQPGFGDSAPSPDVGRQESMQEQPMGPSPQMMQRQMGRFRRRF